MRDLPRPDAFERVVWAEDSEARYRAVIALHSTALGPAVGGTRRWHYASEAEAIADARALARAMTLKCAIADLPLGGGKAVILDDVTADRAAVYRAHGRAVAALGGAFITANDVGTGAAELAHARAETRWVAGMRANPAPYTARGVVAGMRAVALERWGSDDLAGRVVAVQGCGGVGGAVAHELSRRGVSLVVADVDPDRACGIAARYGARVVPPPDVLAARCDVLAPCALGGVLSDASIPALRCAVVCGGANNQLAGPTDDAALAARGILYAPDFVVNAGGVLSGCAEILGWSDVVVELRIALIVDTVRAIFAFARARQVTTQAAAVRMAEQRLAFGGARPR